MTGYEVYRFYLAIKLHFTQESYDVFKNRGNVINCSPESFLKRRGVGRFNSIANILETPKDAVQFFVACQAYNVDIFDPQAADDAFLKWKRHKQMTTQLILDDLEQLNLQTCLVGSPCELQKRVSGNATNIETAVALNRVYNFTNSWKNNFVYSSLGLKIMKLDKFIKYNEEKIVSYIKDHELQEA